MQKTISIGCIVFTVVSLLASMGFAHAVSVDINTADQATLDSVKGVGPELSQAILKSRQEGGVFKNWQDFQARVKGVGDKRIHKLSAAGLTIDGTLP